MTDLGFEKRKFILLTSLFVEKTTSAFLAALLGIDDFEESKTLGNKGSSLSFSNKIDLLIDIGALKPETKKKFRHFMSIRNQFMHNISASSYEKCIARLDGTENFLSKTYPQKSSLSNEIKLERSISALCDDVARLTTEITKSVDRKIQKEELVTVFKKSQEAMVATFDEVSIKFDEHFKKVIESRTKLTASDFKNFGSELRKFLFGVWHKKFKSLTESEDISESSI
ncbi:hypothetical protein [Reichenbachiella sp.]